MMLLGTALIRHTENQPKAVQMIEHGPAYMDKFFSIDPTMRVRLPADFFRRFRNMEKHDVFKRETWSSGFGFIMSAAGSAVGLGNIWKFPYVCGTNGGAVFLLFYVMFALLLGYPILLAELAVGRHGRTNAADCCESIKKGWGFIGILGGISAFCVLSYYSVVGGWVFKYFMSCLFSGVPDSSFFESYTAGTYEPVLWQFVFILISFLIVAKGVSSGIEKVSSVLLPLLFVFLTGLMVYSLSLPNAWEGVKFFLMPASEGTDIGSVIVSALGQVFFSLSLGMGTLITYGSYLSRENSLPKSTGIIVLLDTIAAVISGLVILPAVFSFGLEPDKGAGLIFSTLTEVFGSIGGGRTAGTLFFLLVLFASVTSAISLLEMASSLLSDRLSLSKASAAAITSAIVFLAGIPVSLSLGILSDIELNGLSLFELPVFISDNITLPLGGFFLCILAGRIWGRKSFDEEITAGGRHSFPFSGTVSFILRYAAPCIILLITLIPFFSR